jgi:hypothetical protein
MAARISAAGNRLVIKKGERRHFRGAIGRLASYEQMAQGAQPDTGLQPREAGCGPPLTVEAPSTWESIRISVALDFLQQTVRAAITTAHWTIEKDMDGPPLS